jgi:hypothetical protein
LKAEREEIVVRGADAIEAPIGVGDGLDGFGFAQALSLEPKPAFVFGSDSASGANGVFTIDGGATRIGRELKLIYAALNC